MLFGSSNHGHWTAKFRAAHPYIVAAPPDPGVLRFILGVGRSGTSWVSQVFSRTSERCRFFSEPLFHVVPRLPFHKAGDHTALCYEEVGGEHPLAAVYQLLAHREFGTGFQPREREDADWRICLVKEVHALLGTEGLLRAWRTPTLFIVRDPVYVADSLFAAQTLQTIYLDHEVQAVQQEHFLERFVPRRHEAVKRLFAEAAGKPQRLHLVLTKLICIQLLQEMFSVLAEEFSCAKAIRYEEFCERPREAFQSAAAALSIAWDASMEGYLGKTMQADSTSADPYSVMRNTSEQKARPYKFLSSQEISLCRATLDRLAA